MEFNHIYAERTIPDNLNLNNLSSNGKHEASFSPTQLLSLAIKKRRQLCDEKERDYRRELLQTQLIRHLCKCLGEGRAKARRRRNRRRFSPMRHWEVKGERDQEVPSGSCSPDFHNQIGAGFESALQNQDGLGVDTISAFEEIPSKRIRLEDCDQCDGNEFDAYKLQIVEGAGHKTGGVDERRDITSVQNCDHK